MKKILFLIVLSAFGILKSQIPNNGFESWTVTGGYNNPNNWGNLNATTKPYSVYTCSKLSPGNPGGSYLAVISQSITGKGVVPGRVVSGKIDSLTYKPISGFPFGSRPASLSYNMQYMVSLPTDTAYVEVNLTKWNNTLMKRDTIGKGKAIYNAMAHSWFTSNLYINYSSGDFPDSACIVISASSKNPLHNSFMYIDNLQFSGGVIGVAEHQTTSSELNIYPNPSNDTFYYKVNATDANEQFDIIVLDIKGSLHLKLENMGAVGVIDISDWQKGTYFLEIANKKKFYRNKIIIN